MDQSVHLSTSLQRHGAFQNVVTLLKIHQTPLQGGDRVYYVGAMSDGGDGVFVCSRLVMQAAVCSSIVTPGTFTTTLCKLRKLIVNTHTYKHQNRTPPHTAQHLSNTANGPCCNSQQRHDNHDPQKVVAAHCL